MKMEQSVPKRRHIKFRRRGITQKKTYDIQNTAKGWNQEYHEGSSEIEKGYKLEGFCRDVNKVTEIRQVLLGRRSVHEECKARYEC